MGTLMNKHPHPSVYMLSFKLMNVQNKKGATHFFITVFKSLLLVCVYFVVYVDSI